MSEDNKDAGGPYLFVEPSITPDGDLEVLSAEEMPGTPVTQKAPTSRFASTLPETKGRFLPYLK